MNDERIHAVEAFYDFHPISLTQILQALEAKGIKLDKIKPCDLLPHDQDHYGGVAAVDRIIAHAALSSDDHVLDVCSGLGGPARYIATQRGCRVTGLDLTASRVEGARKLSELTGLDHLVDFVHGNALAMPFAAGRFSALVSQEAFAHIPNKAKLVQSCAQQLRPGGRMVFTDILWRQKPTPEDEAALFQGMRFSEVASVDGYQRLFAAEGLRCIDVLDLSDAWTQILIERHAMYRSLKAQTIQNLGIDHFERYDRAYDHFVNLFSTRKLGGALMQFANG